MPTLKVLSTALTAATADQAWAVVRDFCAPWHPAIARMEPERAGNAGLIRRFTVKGEDRVYRERLSFYSESEREMAYHHIEGIAGVQSYQGRLRITQADRGAEIEMSAELTAPEGRAAQIAQGTKAIFDAGVAHIAELAPKGDAAPAPDVAIEDTKTHSISIDGPASIALSVTSHPRDTLCLFLHGIGGNRSNWDAQLAAAAPYCQAASMDLRGYGDSTLGPAQSIVEDYCDDILRIADHLRPKRLVLCGLSYGAWIATSFAMRHQERLWGLVLAGGCTGMSEADEGERTRFRETREAPLLAGQTPADFAPAVVDVIAGPDATIPVRETLRRSMAAIPAATYADALRCFTNPAERFDFSRIACPTMMVTGMHDRLAPPKEIRGVADRIWQASAQPDVRFEVIGGAGHLCNLENPALFNATLQAFLQKVSA